jgi:sensor domain CHASE-containing protein
LISSILIIVISFLNVVYLSWRNKIKKRPEERAKLLEKYMETNEQLEGEDDGELRAWTELGDRHPDFVYTI